MTLTKAFSAGCISLLFICPSVLQAEQMERIEDKNGKILTKSIVVYEKQSSELKFKKNRNPKQKIKASKSYTPKNI